MTASLRIVLAIESSGPGGAEKMVLNLAGALRERGHTPIVASMRPGWMTERAERDGHPLWLLPQKPGVDLPWVFRLARRLRREAIDIFHSHEFAMNIFGGISTRLARIPALSTIHGRHWVSEQSRRVIAYRVLRRGGIPIVPVSHDLAGFLAERFRLQREELPVVHNGIPLSARREPDRAQCRSQLGLPPDSPLLVAVGNLYPVKDHSTLVRALQRVPNARVAIAGRGEEEERLIKLAGELGVQSRFHLLGLRDDIDVVLGAADVFVLPSLSEGLPLALLEAMAASLPIVATDVGGISEAIEHDRSGLLVPSGQPEALASAITQILGSEELRLKLGRSARERAEAQFGVSAMAQQYEQLYAKQLRT